MLIQPPKLLELRIDNHEKDVIPFPTQLDWRDDRGNHRVFEVRHKYEYLETGDFLLRNYESITGMERKRGFQELRDNLYTGDKKRFMRAIARLCKMCKYPYLFLELPSLKDWEVKYGEQTYGAVLDTTTRFVLRRGLRPFIFAKSLGPIDRKHMGETILRLLWGTVWEHLNGTPARLESPKCPTSQSSLRSFAGMPLTQTPLVIASPTPISV